MHVSFQINEAVVLVFVFQTRVRKAIWTRRDIAHPSSRLVFFVRSLHWLYIYYIYTCILNKARELLHVSAKAMVNALAFSAKIPLLLSAVTCLYVNVVLAI